MTKTQRELLKAQLANEPEGTRCPVCWMTTCGHEVESVEDNPFINLTEEVSSTNELQFA